MEDVERAPLARTQDLRQAHVLVTQAIRHLPVMERTVLLSTTVLPTTEDVVVTHSVHRLVQLPAHVRVMLDIRHRVETEKTVHPSTTV